jgi:hypothetical protein
MLATRRKKGAVAMSSNKSVDRLRYWLDHSNWEFLRAVVSSRGAQATVAFPLVGYLILLNDRVKHALSMHEATHGQTWLATDDRLFMVYFGLCAIGLGVAVFNVRCPFLMKRFQGKTECAQFYMQIADIGQIYCLLINVLGVSNEARNPLYDEFNKRYTELDGDQAAWQGFVERWRQSIFGFYVTWYNNTSVTRRTSRSVCLLLLSLGVLLLSVPSADTFVAVARVFFN